MKFTAKSPRESNRCTPLSKAELEQVRGGTARAVSEDSATEVMNNPLYTASGVEATNPLFDV